MVDPVPIGLNSALPQCFLLTIVCWASDTVGLAKYRVLYDSSLPSYYQATTGTPLSIPVAGFSLNDPECALLEDWDLVAEVGGRPEKLPSGDYNNVRTVGPVSFACTPPNMPLCGKLTVDTTLVQVVKLYVLGKARTFNGGARFYGVSHMFTVNITEKVNMFTPALEVSPDPKKQVEYNTTATI